MPTQAPLAIYGQGLEESGIPLTGEAVLGLGEPAAHAAPGSLPVHRAIIALDMERSTLRTNTVKEELRRCIYQLLSEALFSAGIGSHHLDRLTDRGDGVLALVRPVDEVPKTLLLAPLIPSLCTLLADYNSSEFAATDADRRLRLRVVVHAGEVHDDGRGFFGECLDIAFRLLDAPPVKRALRSTAAPLVLVVSEDIFRSIVRHGYDGIDGDSYEPLVRVRVAGRLHQGWIHVPVEPAA